MAEDEKKFTETLINMLLNNSIIRFILIFGITGLIIYSLIAVNPFDVINKYSLFSYIFFFILILLASSAVIFFNIYKNNPRMFQEKVDPKNKDVNFFDKETSEYAMKFLSKALVIIGIIFLFFAVISGIYILALNTPNIVRFMNIMLITVTTIIVLTILYGFSEREFKRLQGDGGDKSLGDFIKDIIFFIPCLLIDFIKYMEKEFKMTIKLTWILLGLEIVVILLYFLIPYLVRNIALQGGKQLLEGPVYTNNITTLGTYQNLVVKNENKLIFNYNYSISFSIWINPQPINTNINYNKYTSLFNYANKPNILYNAQTNTIKIVCRDKKNNLVNIYKTNKFPYQSWMNFVIILRTGVMDIFLNNDLVASVSGVTPYMRNDKVTAGEKDGINGGIKNILYFNKPLSKNEIMWIK